METLISDQAKFQKLLVSENKDYNFMVKEKKLVDNILDTLHEKNVITRDIKTIFATDGSSPARLYGLPKIHEALVMVFQIIDQLYLKIALPYIKLQNIN